MNDLTPTDARAITAVYRETLKRGEVLLGYRFYDQAGNVLRKKATRPYSHMAINGTSYNDRKWLSFHCTPTPSPTYKSYVIERVIAIHEACTRSCCKPKEDAR